MEYISEFGIGTLKITNVKYEAATGSTTSHSDLGENTVGVEIVFSTPSNSDASGWAETGGVNWYWEAGVSFIYDEKQESLITLLEGELTGTHDGSANASSLDDSTTSFVVNGLSRMET